MESTSLTLLERLRANGNGSAWRRFVDLYTPLLHLWARRAGLPEAEAADIVQDVTNEMPRFIYDGERKNFRGWLKTITINRCRDRQRKKAPLNAADVDSAVFELAAGPAAEEFWEKEYHLHLFQQALAVMKAEFETKTWRACWETTVNERPAKEVAAELDMSEAAVYVAKSRVLRRLRHELWDLWE